MSYFLALIANVRNDGTRRSMAIVRRTAGMGRSLHIRGRGGEPTYATYKIWSTENCLSCLNTQKLWRPKMFTLVFRVELDRFENTGFPVLSPDALGCKE